jgi:hypothetical protein
LFGNGEAPIELRVLSEPTAKAETVPVPAPTAKTTRTAAVVRATNCSRDSLRAF